MLVAITGIQNTGTETGQAGYTLDSILYEDVRNYSDSSHFVVPDPGIRVRRWNPKKVESRSVYNRLEKELGEAFREVSVLASAKATALHLISRSA
jgi:hypothetical protein